MIPSLPKPGHLLPRTLATKLLYTYPPAPSTHSPRIPQSLSPPTSTITDRHSSDTTSSTVTPDTSLYTRVYLGTLCTHPATPVGSDILLSPSNTSPNSTTTTSPLPSGIPSTVRQLQESALTQWTSCSIHLLPASQAIQQVQPSPQQINTGLVIDDQTSATTTDQSTGAAHVTPSKAHHQALLQSSSHSLFTLSSLSSIHQEQPRPPQPNTASTLSAIPTCTTTCQSPAGAPTIHSNDVHWALIQSTNHSVHTITESFSTQQAKPRSQQARTAFASDASSKSPNSSRITNVGMQLTPSIAELLSSPLVCLFSLTLPTIPSLHLPEQSKTRFSSSMTTSARNISHTTDSANILPTLSTPTALMPETNPLVTLPSSTQALALVTPLIQHSHTGLGNLVLPSCTSTIVAMFTLMLLLEYPLLRLTLRWINSH